MDGVMALEWALPPHTPLHTHIYQRNQSSICPLIKKSPYTPHTQINKNKQQNRGTPDLERTVQRFLSASAAISASKPPKAAAAAKAASAGGGKGKKGGRGKEEKGQQGGKSRAASSALRRVGLRDLLEVYRAAITLGGWLGVLFRGVCPLFICLWGGMRMNF